MKKLLLATVFSLFSFSVQAQEQMNGYPAARTYADMTNPFYIPERTFSADSNLSYSRVKLNASLNAPAKSGFPVLKNASKYMASETLTYGITGTWAIYGTFAYDWTKKRELLLFGIGLGRSGPKLIRLKRLGAFKSALM